MSSSIDSEKEVEENYIENFVQNDAGAYGLDAVAEPRTFTDSVITKNVSTVTEYYRYVFSQNKNSGGSIGFIPFKISFTMDGISGFKIYNKIKLNLKFLSKDYQNFLNFVITEINNKIADQDWETEISAIVHPETNIISPTIKRAKQLVNVARTPPVLPGSTAPTGLITGGSGLDPIKAIIVKDESGGDYESLFASTTYVKAFGVSILTQTIQQVVNNTKNRYVYSKSGASVSSRAVGKYQVLGELLANIATKAGLQLTDLYNEVNQEKIGDQFILTERPKLAAYLKGGPNKGTQSDLENAVSDLAACWTSKPTVFNKNGNKVGDVTQSGPASGNKAYFTSGINSKDKSMYVSDVVQALIRSRIQYSDRPSFIPTYYTP
jgi:muramidase (phage lysozyme)